MSDAQRLTILELEVQLMTARLDVIDRQLAKINGRLDTIETTLEGNARGIQALLRHFNLDDQ
jgi:hypothetical protein